jgi:hypothetical protein
MITFPLVLGWVHFEADPANPANYRAYLLGMPAGSFPSESLVGWMTFHALDFCAIAVIIGMAIAMRRRMGDRGAITVQQFTMDFVPLVMLFAVCVTGLMLTVSALWLRGHSYSFIALLHAFSVIVTLLYLPFGKFFHIFQRPAQIGVGFYKDAGARGEQAQCRRCGQPYASAMIVRDLTTVERQLGFSYEMEPSQGADHYQQICPRCRRALFGLAQGRAWSDQLTDRLSSTSS